MKKARVVYSAAFKYIDAVCFTLAVTEVFTVTPMRADATTFETTLSAVIVPSGAVVVLALTVVFGFPHTALSNCSEYLSRLTRRCHVRSQFDRLSAIGVGLKAKCASVTMATEPDASAARVGAE
jgi:hypothetical protein